MFYLMRGATHTKKKTHIKHDSSFMKYQITKPICGGRNQETFALDERIQLQSGKSKWAGSEK